MAALDINLRPALKIGAIEIRPLDREVAGPSSTEAIEPKVMAVLTRLLDADGAVVTREALIHDCWQGQAVGDDVITRVISKIRRLSQGVAAGAFTVETISKAGYRLRTTGASTRPPEPQGPDKPAALAKATSAPSGRRRAAAWSVPLAIAALAAGWWTIGIGSKPPRVSSAIAPARNPSDLPGEDLMTRGRAAVFEGTVAQLGQAIGYFREATVRAPTDPDAWASLAMTEVLSLSQTPSDGRPALAARIHEDAGRALALDPRRGHGLAALAVMAPTFGHWAAKEALLERDLAVAPKTTALLFQQAQLFSAVGRGRKAMDPVDQTAAQAPLLPWIQAERISLLARAGRTDEAREAAERAGRLWPHDRRLWFTRFFLAAFDGEEAKALAMAADRSGWPTPDAAGDIALGARAVRAAANPSMGAANAVAGAYEQQADGGGDAAQGMQVDAALGRLDAAYSLARRLYIGHPPPPAFNSGVGPVSPDEPDTAALFGPTMRRFWADPRFMPLMVEIGLVDYWRKNGGPDLCLDAALHPRCVAEGIG